MLSGDAFQDKSCGNDVPVARGGSVSMHASMLELALLQHEQPPVLQPHCRSLELPIYVHLRRICGTQENKQQHTRIVALTDLEFQACPRHLHREICSTSSLLDSIDSCTSHNAVSSLFPQHIRKGMAFVQCLACGWM